MDAGKFLGRRRLVRERGGADAVGAFEVDHPAIDEPAERRVERRELLGGETIVGVVGVQEVKGVLEIHVPKAVAPPIVAAWNSSDSQTPRTLRAAARCGDSRSSSPW